MMGGFLSRVLLLAFGYAYPAYECYKTVELNKPEIEQLIFWCQYWILVALMTVLERFGDFTISWLPFYSEAKLMFFIYLWYPKTKGTTYIYGTFFKPYISQHENEIDRNLLELRARATDVVVLYFQKAATVGQNTFFDVLKYVASQSSSQKSRKQSSQEPQQTQVQQQQQQPQKQPPTVIRRSASIAARQAAMAQQSQEAKTVPSSPKIKRQASSKMVPVASTKSTVAAAVSTRPDANSPKKNEVTTAPLQVSAPATNADVPTSDPSAPPLPEVEEVEKMAIDEADDTVEGTEVLEPVRGETAEERPMEETIRVTRAKLRSRAAAAEDPAGN
ncbi:hypothetical protein GUJ93_ZPchr0013g34782 [Zizania palustris]|uniref:HVA22-like protein n=1 Tax=Zizania palustris TaxID=103762 RepID=A0A8J6BVL4_ZIZPA|nr:hypothetical protein GUJ93_ZPchr0013g34782 [Zizania palustris]